MKAWEVIAVTHGSEIVCRNCCTAEERRCWDDKEPFDEICVVFASDELDENECCSRCGAKLMGD